ncbi:phosphatase PAP2 family protein [Microbacterium sp. ASV49]|uniref:Phosphatase PAP2 family protein n=1 Tax=Microbacterium candidum TaxID=3041922 RepID=A0ABT7MVM6_9MICO|nr:phosphatase PAP2 family protein [Microbacterium sp. ASV49]MDL9978501.1 phosphatase PAP2 family protein [Microbacterium sp. ASV49]
MPPAQRVAFRIRPVVFAVAAFVVVLAAGLLIVANPAWSAAELKIVVAVNAAWTPFLDAVAKTINVVFGPQGAVFVAIGVAAIVWISTRSWRVTVRLVFAAGLAWAIADIVKPIVGRLRPDPSAMTHLIIPDPLTYSYPSGHTAFATALGAGIAIVVVTGRMRALAVVLAVALAVVTAWSRVYLGVHYPTDTLAAMVLVPFLVIGLDAVGRWAIARFAPTHAAD